MMMPNYNKMTIMHDVLQTVKQLTDDLSCLNHSAAVTALPQLVVVPVAAVVSIRVGFIRGFIRVGRFYSWLRVGFIRVGR
jgi:hypothetical protein